MTYRPGDRYHHQVRTNHADWTALCHQSGENPELWFSESSTRTRKAIAIGNRCPIQRVCLQYAIDTDTRYGIWGGLTEAMRAELTEAAGGGLMVTPAVLDTTYRL